MPTVPVYTDSADAHIETDLTGTPVPLATARNKKQSDNAWQIRFIKIQIGHIAHTKITLKITSDTHEIAKITLKRTTKTWKNTKITPKSHQAHIKHIKNILITPKTHRTDENNIKAHGNQTKHLEITPITMPNITTLDVYRCSPILQFHQITLHTH